MKKISINYKPLDKSVNLRVVSGSPAQQYNATIGEYVPDFTLVPLVIQPDVRILDPDNIIPAGLKNSSLTNVVWYKNQVSASSAISTTDTSYVVDNTATDNRGRITVKKNIPEGEQLTLIFTAAFLDTRTGYSVPVMGSIALTVSQETETSAPRIVAAYPNGALLYPVTGQKGLKISAPLITAKGEVKDVVYDWMIYENSAYRKLTVDDGVKGLNTSILWVPAKLLTRRTKIKSVAKCRDDTFEREHVIGISYERYEVDVIVPGAGEVSPSATSVTVKAEVSTNAKVVKSPERYFLIEWYDQNNNKLGEGENLEVAKEKYAVAGFGVDVKVSERYSGLQVGEKIWVLKESVGDFSEMNINNALKTTGLGNTLLVFYFQMISMNINFIPTNNENFSLVVGRVVSDSKSETIMITNNFILYSILSGENSKYGVINCNGNIKLNGLNSIDIKYSSSNSTMSAVLNDVDLGSYTLDNGEFYGFGLAAGTNDVGIITNECFLKSILWGDVTILDFINGNLEAYLKGNPATRFKFSLTGTADSELTQQIEI